MDKFKRVLVAILLGAVIVFAVEYTAGTFGLIPELGITKWCIHVGVYLFVGFIIGGTARS